MSFDTSWDVDKYKSDFESEEHWQLRRDFMNAHKFKCSEEKLVCLAQVFFNVEFMGCRYPEKTMKLIEELSKDIAANHREQQKAKIQRTFVKASDAAGARIKGIKHSGNSSKETQPTNDGLRTNNQTSGGSQFLDNLGNTFNTTSVDELPFISKDNNFVPTRFNNFIETSKNITMEEIRSTSGPFGTVVIFYSVGEHPNCTIQRFIKQWNIRLKMSTKKLPGGMSFSTIYLNHILMGSSKDYTQKASLFDAAMQTVKSLTSTYFSVKIKCRFWGDDVVTKSDGIENTSSENPSDAKSDPTDDKLTNENVGHKLMKMMGWTGGGLGKNEQGIVEPIKAFQKQDRSGIGNSKGIEVNKKNLTTSSLNFDEESRVKQIILDYKHSNNYNDLVFSASFSKQHRATFHSFAQRIGLKSKSYGNKSGDSRQLVVSKKVNNWVIIGGLVKESSHFYNKFELVRPGELNPSDFATQNKNSHNGVLGGKGIISQIILLCKRTKRLYMNMCPESLRKISSGFQLPRYNDPILKLVGHYLIEELNKRFEVHTPTN